MKILITVLFLSVSLIARAEFNDSIPQTDNGQADWTKVIKIGESVSYFVAGVADYKALAKYVRAKNPEVKLKRNWLAMGKVNVGFGISFNRKFFGCGCPEAFDEFLMFYDVESKNPGDQQSAPDFLVTNQILRQNSMTFKFGSDIRMGQITVPNAGRPSFKVVSADGAIDIELSFDVPVNKINYREKMVNAGLHTLGGFSFMEGSEGTPLQPKFFRIRGPSKEFQTTFLLGTPRLQMQINPDSLFGRHLKNIGFTPLAFIARQMKDGMAWLPKGNE